MSIPRSSEDRDLLKPNKVSIQLRFAVLQQHGDHLLEVGLQFIQTFGLAMGARKSGHVAYKQACLRTTLNHR